MVNFEVRQLVTLLGHVAHVACGTLYVCVAAHVFAPAQGGTLAAPASPCIKHDMSHLQLRQCARVGCVAAGIINAVVGIPTMISFAAIVYQVWLAAWC